MSTAVVEDRYASGYRTARGRYMAERAAEWFKDHTVEVLLERGVYRHYWCQKPGTVNMSFAIVTVPGRLMVSGDVGDLVVSRVYDMLTWAHSVRDLSYFESKVWRCIKTKEYSEEAAREALKWEYESHVADCGFDERRRHDKISRELMEHVDDEHSMVQAYYDSEWYNGDMPSFEDYTYEFYRCAEALRWFLRWLDRNRPNVEAAPWPAPDYSI